MSPRDAGLPGAQLPETLASRWRTHPDAEALVARLLDEALAASAGLRAWADRLRPETSTRLTDWVDHVVADVDEAALAGAGFEADPVSGTWRHPGAQLAAVLPAPAPAPAWRVGVRADDVERFAAVTEGAGPVRGRACGPLRTVEVPLDGGVTLVALERRSWSAGTWGPAAEPGGTDEAGAAALRAFRARDRAAGYPALQRTVEEGVAAVGADVATAMFAQAEREHWQVRNAAARLQHGRQDALGLGWGNADHHTFRSSRAGFAPLLGALHALGFADREKFHAGEAGWGAQVLEQAGAGVVVFADVDLDVAELPEDWALGLDQRSDLRTVGLWCAMFGDSVLEAGMHHLEGQFDFDALTDDLAAAGVGSLPPFSDLPHLRQAFTEAERWAVPPGRLEALVGSAQLTREKAEELAGRGAPGSHLENLARVGGFKGFNQRSVSDIIARTDARVYAGR